MLPSIPVPIPWDGHGNRSQVPVLPVRSQGGKKGKKIEKKELGGEGGEKTEPGPNSPLQGSQRRDGGDPLELLKGVLVYMYLYNSRGWAQRGYIIYTHTYRHTGLVAGKTDVSASS